MANTISPNMSLIVPGVGSEAGPTYALDVNASLSLIDSHDHSPGKGVQITPAGININALFSMNNNVVSEVQDLQFQAQSTASVLPQGLSVAPGGETPPQQDLWYTPDTGIPIQLTKNGTVNATIASIPGESYSTGTFFWTQAQDGLPTNPASFDIGAITLRPNIAATAFGAHIIPPLASTYDLTLFPALPAANNIVRLDTTGHLTATLGVDSSTIIISGNTLEVGTITASNIASGTFVAANMQFLPNLNATTFNTPGSTTFTVPDGITSIFVVMAGGGGGGASGTISTLPAVKGGGGGGSGAIPFMAVQQVQPGDVLNITVGTGGTGGAQLAGSSGGTLGLAGNPGTASTVTNVTRNISLRANGASGGNAPTNSTGGPATTPTWGPSGSNSSGGAGNSDVGVAGSGGMNSFYANTAIGGTGTGTGLGNGGCGGGGGGGSGLNIGGAGGNGAIFNTSSNGAPGSAGPTGGCGGGGGGAGSGTTSANHSGAGGAGGAGTVIIYTGSFTDT
jgi:hypothetical protein